jgi:hypothetical protein
MVFIVEAIYFLCNDFIGAALNIFDLAGTVD